MRQSALVVLCIICCLLASSQVQGQTVWHVYEDGSGDAPDITTAVLWATNGDSIIVHAGTYYESQITINETLTIIGIDGPEVTAVDMANVTRCFFLPDNSSIFSNC